jgi:hypothetical protein
MWDILYRKISGSGQKESLLSKWTKRRTEGKTSNHYFNFVCAFTTTAERCFGRAHSAELTHFIPPNAKFISSLPVLISFSLTHSLFTTQKPDPDAVRMSEREFHVLWHIPSSEFSIAFYNALLPHSAFLSLSLLSCLPALCCCLMMMVPYTLHII